MKKSLIILALLSLGITSCKKDRVCSCKTVYKTTGAPIAISDVVIDDKYTLVDANYKTAFNHCTHTFQESTNTGITTSIDKNCSLD